MRGERAADAGRLSAEARCRGRGSGARGREGGRWARFVEIVAAWVVLAVAVGAIWTAVGVLSSPRVAEALGALGGGR